jgi:hypothetical protein
MALLRCPSCDSKGEVMSHDPQVRFRCAKCGHRFVAGEADSTHEYNIFADDSPLFLPETASGLDALSLQPRWRSWVGRFAKHRGLDEGELVRRALVAFALRTGFSEPPPVD